MSDQHDHERKQQPKPLRPIHNDNIDDVVANHEDRQNLRIFGLTRAITAQDERIAALESHFDHGGRVWTLENRWTWMTGIWCSATFFGAAIWYVIERWIEMTKK